MLIAGMLFSNVVQSSAMVRELIKGLGTEKAKVVKALYLFLRQYNHFCSFDQY